MEIKIIHKVMKLNDDVAQLVRERLDEHGVTAINIISAPGSGKTSLLERAIPLLEGDVRLGVIEGDPETARDAERIAPLGAPVVQINTDGGCHLEANLVAHALDQFNLDQIDLLAIENVGNLVCPVEFKLGETYRVAVVSVPEGDDKPIKYPKLFRNADVCVLNKVDLLPYVDFDIAQFRADLARLNPGLKVLKVSCRTGEGIDLWVDWLRECIRHPSSLAAEA